MREPTYGDQSKRQGGGLRMPEDAYAEGNATYEDAIKALNNLIETCKDGSDGFKNAAQDIKDSAVKTMFMKFSGERAKFVTELQGEVRALGGDPEKSGSAAAAMHRGWMDLRAAINSKDTFVVLSECERGEDYAVKAYEDAMAEGKLPSSAMDTVQRQFTSVKAAHDQVRDLRDTYKNARKDDDKMDTEPGYKM